MILISISRMIVLVVFYNLNNINVSERIENYRQLKVLGFYDDKVTMYILKKIIFNSLGTIIGLVIGKMLHAFIITTSEADTMMLSPNVSIASYLFRN